MSTRNLTIMFTDIKGFTERTAAHNRDFVVKMLEKQDKICKPIFARYHGTIIKTIGDAYLVTFESPTNAVICGLMLQHGLRNYNRAATADEKIDIRVAINTGEVSLVGTDVFGDPVNVASRVEGITEAGEVWFTEATYLAMNKQEVPTSIVGEFKLKGVPEAIRVYRGLVDETQILYKRDFPANGHAGALGPAAKPFEPQRDPGASRAVKKGVMVGGLVIALTGTIAFTILMKPSPEKQVLKLMDEKKYPQAMQALEPLLAQDPTRELLQDLARQASEGEIRSMLASGQTADAQARFDRYAGKFTFLGAQSQLRRDIRMAEVAQHDKGGKDTFKEQEALRADYPEDPEVLAFIGSLRLQYGPSGLRAAMPYFRKALKNDKAIASHPAIQKAFTAALDELSPYELFQSNDHTQLYLDHFYAPNRAKLLENVYDPKSDSKRWVAYELLSRNGEAKEVDALRFHWLNLKDESVHGEYALKTLSYFETEYDGKKADPLPLFPLLFNSEEEPAKRALALARGKLRPNLEAALAEAKKSDDERKKEIVAKIEAK